MNIEYEYRRYLQPAWLLLLGITLLRLIVAARIDLSVDEAHYFLYGLYPDWSYFDHPPLVGWLQWLSLQILGRGELWARLPAIIIAVITSLVYLNLLKPYLTDHNTTSSIALWVTLALNSSVGFAALSLMLLPDTILCLEQGLFIMATEQVRIRGNTRDWLLLGLVTGLAGLTKYSAILFPLALLITLIETGQWRHFGNFRLLSAVAVASLLIMPVLLWNWAHDFASFAYQQQRVLGFAELKVSNLLISYVGHLLLFGPLVTPLAGLGLWQLAKQPASTRDPHGFVARLMWWLCCVLLVFFSLAALGKPTLPHWWAGLYVLTIPLGTVTLLRAYDSRAAIWGRRAIMTNALLAGLLHLELAYPFLPMPDYLSLHRDIRGWPAIMARAETLLATHTDPNAYIAVPNWSLGSRAMYYAKDARRIMVVDQRTDQFDLWQSARPEGKDILFIMPKHFHSTVNDRYRCRAIVEADEVIVTVPTHVVDKVSLVWCQGFAGFRR